VLPALRPTGALIQASGHANTPWLMPRHAGGLTPSLNALITRVGPTIPRFLMRAQLGETKFLMQIGKDRNRIPDAKN
jgi:hypothetical protein